MIILMALSAKTKNILRSLGLWLLLLVNVFAIIIAVVVVVASVYIQDQIVTTTNKIYEPVVKIYDKTNDVINRIDNGLSILYEKTDKTSAVAEVFASTSGDILPGARTKVAEGLLSANEKVSEVNDFLSSGLENINSFNSTVSVINQIPSVSIPTFSGERITRAQEKLSGISENLKNASAAVENPKNGRGQVVKKSFDSAKEGILNAKTTVSEYRTNLDQIKKQIDLYKFLVILWTRIGTVAIVAFFVWSVISFGNFIKNNYSKIKELNIKRKELK